MSIIIGIISLLRTAFLSHNNPKATIEAIMSVEIMRENEKIISAIKAPGYYVDYYE